jgi:hypothetical protein
MWDVLEVRHGASSALIWEDNMDAFCDVANGSCGI